MRWYVCHQCGAKLLRADLGQGSIEIKCRVTRCGAMNIFTSDVVPLAAREMVPDGYGGAVAKELSVG